MAAIAVSTGAVVVGRSLLKAVGEGMARPEIGAPVDGRRSGVYTYTRFPPSTR